MTPVRRVKDGGRIIVELETSAGCRSWESAGLGFKFCESKDPVDIKSYVAELKKSDQKEFLLIMDTCQTDRGRIRDMCIWIQSTESGLFHDREAPGKMRWARDVYYHPPTDEEMLGIVEYIVSANKKSSFERNYR